MKKSYLIAKEIFLIQPAKKAHFLGIQKSVL